MKFRIEYRVLLALTGALLLVGTIFYHFVEQFSWLDSIYFCVVSLATVGYGDLHPTTALGKVFTIFYILIGVGVLVSFFSTLTHSFIERRTKHVEHARENENNTPH